jgi:hypothetical protein
MKNVATLYYKNSGFRLIEDWYPLFLTLYGGTYTFQFIHPIVNCAVKKIDSIHSLIVIISHHLAQHVLSFVTAIITFKKTLREINRSV